MNWELFFKIFEIIILFGIIPLVKIILKGYADKVKIIEKNQEQIEEKIIKLEKHSSHQMTKEDVKEIVNHAVEKLSLTFELNLSRIENDVHSVKSSQAGKDAINIEILEQLRKLNKNG